MKKYPTVHTQSKERKFVPAYRCVIFAKGLSEEAKVLYLALVSYDWEHIVTEEGEVWPKQQTLRERLGWSERKLRECQKELENYGLIEVKLEGLPAHNVYVFKSLHECQGHCDGILPGELSSLDRQDSADLSTKPKNGPKRGKNGHETASQTDRQDSADLDRQDSADHMKENHLKETNLLKETLPPNPPSGGNVSESASASPQTPDSPPDVASTESLSSVEESKKRTNGTRRRKTIPAALDEQNPGTGEPTAVDRIRVGVKDTVEKERQKRFDTPAWEREWLSWLTEFNEAQVIAAHWAVWKRGFNPQAADTVEAALRGTLQEKFVPQENNEPGSRQRKEWTGWNAETETETEAGFLPPSAKELAQGLVATKTGILPVTG